MARRYRYTDDAKGCAIQMKVNRNIKTPLYRQVYEAIKADILNNHYRESDFLPSERELGDMFQVDRVTVRKALDLLVAEGLVEKTASVGTRVKLPDYSLITGKTIMFILPKRGNEDERITGSFNSNLFYVVEEECKERRCRVIYTTIDEDERLVECLKGYDIAGVIFVSKNDIRVYEEAKSLGIPTVLVNDYYPGFNSVLIDNQTGAYEAIRYLLDRGHSKIAAIAGVPEYPASQERLVGFWRAMVDAGLDLNQYPVQHGYWTYDGGYECMHRLLSDFEDDCPSAVFAFNDWMAYGAIHAIEEYGMRVPDDVSVVGFNGIDLPIAGKLKLTTVRVDIDLMGKSAVEYLQKVVENNDGTSLKIVVPTSLIIGDSVRAVEAT